MTTKANNQIGYLPALDGIRAIAVGAVVAYHLQVPFFDGGLLGVSVFFTLSGYLITSLLLQGFERERRIDLKSFWIRRARRLLPALLLMLPVVGVTTAIARPEKLSATLDQILWALLYVANWTTIARGDDYFQRFSGPGPLDHLWSLAIEEQFYLLWPLIVFVMLQVGTRLKKGRLPLMILTAVLTAASTWAIVHLYDPLAMNNTRAYEGTDARAAALLVGALAAMLLPFDRVGKVSQRARNVLEVIGAVGLAGVVLCIIGTDEYSSFLYRGGELVLSLSTAALSIAAAHPGTLLARVLSASPLQWIGARSYGIYLWHLPVVAFMPSEALVEQPLLRGLIQLVLILVLAALSFRWIEDPIRRHVAVPRPRLSIAFRAVVLVPVATMVLAIWPSCWHPSTELEALAAEPEPEPEIFTFTPVSLPVTPPEPTTNKASTTLPATSLPAATLPMMFLTSCQQVVHIGDSTSVGLVSKALLPNAGDRIAAQYQAVGVQRFYSEISGARSMVETYQERPNATQVAKRHSTSGYHGCWVLALGTNDPANTSGDAKMLSSRIDAMMKIIGDEPVLWTTTKTLRDKGPYQNSHMESWNKTLIEACKRHKNMRVYDWASEVQDDWFMEDNVHFTSTGYKERAERIAQALARAFPKDGSSPSECVIHASN